MWIVLACCNDYTFDTGTACTFELTVNGAF